ncbi:MAG: hypothetical protein FWE17_00465 [Alphaproteobacteria bacterium]|nr:hypothetical protein [Alphaproteobacteria bacterium]MCL2758257.1 hypothetical protein [Alphaproteobacteria bacterium]
MTKNHILNESGRSLIEVVSALAIGAVLIAATFQIYQTVASRQARVMATEELRIIARDAKTLFAGRGGDYTGISVDHLIKMRALNSDRPPRIAKSFSLAAAPEWEGFFINLYGLNFSDCAWISAVRFDWAIGVIVNDNVDGDDIDDICKRGHENKAAIVVR